mgnify:CR=1 FL=1
MNFLKENFQSSNELVKQVMMQDIQRRSYHDLVMDEVLEDADKETAHRINYPKDEPGEN